MFVLQSRLKSDPDAIASFEKERGCREKSVAALSAPVHDDGDLADTDQSSKADATTASNSVEGQSFRPGGVTVAGFKTAVEGATEPEASRMVCTSQVFLDLVRGTFRVLARQPCCHWPCSYLHYWWRWLCPGFIPQMLVLFVMLCF